MAGGPGRPANELNANRAATTTRKAPARRPGAPAARQRYSASSGAGDDHQIRVRRNSPVGVAWSSFSSLPESTCWYFPRWLVPLYHALGNVTFHDSPTDLFRSTRAERPGAATDVAMRRPRLELEDLDAIERSVAAFLDKLKRASALLALYLDGNPLAQAWRTVHPESKCKDTSAQQQASRLLRWFYRQYSDSSRLMLLPACPFPTNAPTLAAAIKERRAENLVLDGIERVPRAESWRMSHPHSKCTDASAQQQASRLLRSWPGILAAQRQRSPRSFPFDHQTVEEILQAAGSEPPECSENG